MQTFITAEDLAPFAEIPQAKAEAMIADVVAKAARIAPCIKDADFADVDAVKAILRGVILRWEANGPSGGRKQLSVGGGGFTQAETHEVFGGGATFRPSEIEELQGLCASTKATSGAFSVDMAPDPYNAHLPWCSLLMSNGTFPCSCGAYIAGQPIYETGEPPVISSTVLPWILPITL